MPTRPTKGNAPAAVTAEASSANPNNVTSRNKQMDSKAQTSHTLCLILGDVTVTQDEDGRYSLNDLHRASGGDPKHAPSRWIRNQQTAEMIQVLEGELTNQKTTETSQIWPVKTIEGRSGGTYVVKELAIDYASWISAGFRLRVIRAYDAMVMAGSSRNMSVEMSVPNWLRSLDG
jgi:hypothetical protein